MRKRNHFGGNKGKLRSDEGRTASADSPSNSGNSSKPDSMANSSLVTDHREMERLREAQLKARARLVLWKRPITTFHYFIRESLHEAKKLAVGLLQHKIKVGLSSAVVIVMLLLYFIEGPLQPYMMELELQILWAMYWIGLGILSSVGLGTGLHTFLLYLGPFIASVTLAAFTCNSLDFPSPPYPKDIICPEEESADQVTFWAIMSKVRFEAFMWGAGTALGELPPYFMARAAQLSGSEVENMDYEQVEALLMSDRRDPLTRAKKAVYKLVKKVGFLGILLCASIPNPLFDLAGITCGHFLVPFWTFFGATLIGKAIIKTHIQKIFVILTFSQHHVEMAVEYIGNIPYAGPYIQSPFSEYLEKQKIKLHRKPGEALVHESSRLQQFFGYLLLMMVIYFLLSIINSMAQSYAKRLDEQELQHKHNRHS